MTTIEELGRRAKQASRHMNRMGTTQKNQILALAAQALVDEQEEILKANAMDIEAARKKNMPEPMVDRLGFIRKPHCRYGRGTYTADCPGRSDW